MNESESQPLVTVVEQPWKQSAKGYIYRMWENLPDDISSQLQQEDRFGISLGGFHYNVKRNDNGGFVVFRNTVEEYQENRRQYFKNSVQRIVEVKVLPIEQANQLLATADRYRTHWNRSSQDPKWRTVSDCRQENVEETRR